MRVDILNWRHFKGGSVNEPFLELFNLGPISKEEFRFIMVNSSDNVRLHEQRHYFPIMRCLNTIHYSKPNNIQDNSIHENDFINVGERVNFKTFLKRLADAPISDDTFQKLINSDNTTADLCENKQNVISLANKIRELGNKLHGFPEFMQVDDAESIYSADKIDFDLEKAIAQSLLDTSENRQMRLKSASKQVERVQVITTIFKRNPDVIVEVLLRAKGECERCKQPAPFLKCRDNSPYLEVHHIIRLADGGSDSIENAQALCPNCHRELHFGT